MNDIEGLTQQISEFILHYGLHLVGAIIALVIGVWIINFIVGRLAKVMEKRNVDPSLVPFLRSVLGILLKVALFISVAGMVGIQVTSFIAVLGAAGLAVGLALQGTLQNFAGGVMILLIKPFKVGDFIEAAGHSGTVKAIQIFNTFLHTPNNQVIIIPNGNLANASVVNYSTNDTRRAVFSFGIDYGDDIDKAKQVLHKIIESDDRILNDPAPMVKVEELGGSSVNITTRVWVKTGDYWDVHYDMLEKVKKTFDQEGLSFPFPQMDVHLDK
ncbi:MAG: mechanosensitive ion channel [Cryomorphaceae bacterium]